MGGKSRCPAGLQFRTPVDLVVKSDEAVNIAVLNNSGEATVLPGQVENGQVTASVPPTIRPERFYATAAPASFETTALARSEAPWFDNATEPGLLAATHAPVAGSVTFEGGIALDQPIAIVAGLRIAELKGLALLVRYDGDARVIPLGNDRIGSRAELTAPPAAAGRGPAVPAGLPFHA